MCPETIVCVVNEAFVVGDITFMSWNTLFSADTLGNKKYQEMFPKSLDNSFAFVVFIYLFVSNICLTHSLPQNN